VNITQFYRSKFGFPNQDKPLWAIRLMLRWFGLIAAIVLLGSSGTAQHARTGIAGATHLRPGLPDGSVHIRSMTAAIPSGATYYIATTGNDSTGTGSSVSPWATPNHAYASMAAGDTLIIKNGTYHQTNLCTRFDGQRPPAGTSVAYTTVQAETDGSVIFDGDNTTSDLSVDNTPASALNYITFRGIVFLHQTGGVGLYACDHIKFLKCGIEGNGSGNTASFSLSTGCTYCLFEDCYAWGADRYKFLIYHSDHDILRRCIVRHDRAFIGVGGNPTASFTCYSSDHVWFQNCIGVDMSPVVFFNGANEYSGEFYAPTPSGWVSSFYMDSCISLHSTMQFCSLGNDQGNPTPDINIRNCVGWDILEGMWIRTNCSIDKCTFGAFRGPALQTVDEGLEYETGTNNIPPTITNSIVRDIPSPGIALSNFLTEDYNDLFNNATVRSGTPTGAHTISTNPSLTYIARIEAGNATLHAAGSSGSDIGANIINQFGTSGTVWGDAGYNTQTASLLWPLPSEAKAAYWMNTYSYTGTEGTITGNRGFASSASIAAHASNPLTYYIWNYLGNGSPY